jgi:hypothetical protein
MLGLHKKFILTDAYLISVMTTWIAKKFILTDAPVLACAAGRRAADPGQVPGEVRRAEGALRKGTQGRLLPC